MSEEVKPEDLPPPEPELEEALDKIELVHDEEEPGLRTDE